MKQNKSIIIIAIIFIIAIVIFMAYDFFGDFSRSEKNVYEYNLDSFEKVDASLVNYKEVQQIVPGIEVLKGIAINNDDNIYVTGEDKILIYNNDGNLLKEINTESNALCITVDEGENIFLGAKDHIEIWSSDGNKKDTWEILNPKVIITSIAISDSSVFVADAGNKIVYHYDMEGNIKNEIGRKDSLAGIQGFIIPSPYFDLAIGRDGELWVVNSGRHQFESYDKKGNQKSTWKKTSMQLDGFSGCCNPSHIAILPNGSFVTSEKGIVRVKIHEPSGEFRSVVAPPELFEKGTRGLDLAVDSENRIIVLDPKKGLVRIFEEK